MADYFSRVCLSWVSTVYFFPRPKLTLSNKTFLQIFTLSFLATFFCHDDVWQA
jgi:hypothetical protein